MERSRARILTHVIAGVDRGFAQGLATARVHPTMMWERFRMLAEGARLASRRLWP